MSTNAIKGFNKDLTCRGFQYVEGQTFEQDTPADLCRSGFHAVTIPMDVFAYYPPAESVYHLVQLDDLDPQTEQDSKVAGRKITIGASLGIPGLVSAHIEWVLSQAKKGGPKAHTDADRSAASSTGYRSAASSTGDQSAASSTGYQSAALSNGNYGTAKTTREKKDTPESVAIVTGYKGSAAGEVGDWLVITERDDNMHILTVQTVAVDGKKILPHVLYTVRGGKVISA